MIVSASWRPSNRIARRIANALLRMLRSVGPPDEWPAWGESACVFACTHSRLTPGMRLQMARLWRQYGDAPMAAEEDPAVADELLGALKLSA